MELSSALFEEYHCIAASCGVLDVSQDTCSQILATPAAIQSTEQLG